MFKNCLFPNGHLYSFITLSILLNMLLFLVMVMRDGVIDITFLTVHHGTLRKYGALDVNKILE